MAVKGNISLQRKSLNCCQGQLADYIAVVGNLLIEKIFSGGYGPAVAMQWEVFAANLKARQKELGMQAQTLASLVGVDAARVSKWRKGLTPDTEMLVKLAVALKCSVDDLLEGVDEDYDAVNRPNAGTESATVETAPGSEQTRVPTARVSQAKPYPIGEADAKELERISAFCGTLATRLRETRTTRAARVRPRRATRQKLPPRRPGGG